MRFRNLAFIALAITITSGCSKISSSINAPHIVQLEFTNTQACNVFFVNTKTDKVAYVFSKEGKFSIDPGEYLVIDVCNTPLNHKYLTRDFDDKKIYESGKSTKFVIGRESKTIQFE